MAGVNSFLIIVNAARVNAFRNQQFSKALWYFLAAARQNNGEIVANSCYSSLTIGVIA
jgi:hypothetical protein